MPLGYYHNLAMDISFHILSNSSITIIQTESQLQHHQKNMVPYKKDINPGKAVISSNGLSRKYC